MNNVLKTTKLVVDNSQSVTINAQSVATSCKKLDFQKIKNWFRADFISLKMFTKQEKVTFLYILQVLFFMYWGSSTWIICYGDYYWDGGYALVTFLIGIFGEKRSLFDLKFLASFGQYEAQYFLMSGNVPAQLYDERLYILKEIGFGCLNRFDGTFVNILKKADTDTVGILNLVLENLPYIGSKVFFHKRVLLVLSDFYYFFQGYTFGIFSNFGRLIVCVDSLLSQILSQLGGREFLATAGARNKSGKPHIF